MALPVPMLELVSQVGESLVTLHEQPADVVTLKLLVVASAETDALVGDAGRIQILRYCRIGLVEARVVVMQLARRRRTARRSALQSAA
jgi:hypothetical protein